MRLFNDDKAGRLLTTRAQGDTMLRSYPLTFSGTRMTTPPEDDTRDLDDIADEDDVIIDFPRLSAPKRDFLHHASNALLKLTGWRVDEPPPDVKKCVVIAAPHTSLWDGLWMVSAAWWWGWRISWLVKNDLVKGPTGKLLRKTGAVPVDRSAPRGLVDQLVDKFEEHDQLFLVIPPEGTRSKRDYWKSGFYHVALQANVPICLTYLDYKEKKAGLGPCFYLTGDVGADMDRIRAFYEKYQGRHPHKFTAPRLRSEDKEGSDA